MQEPVSSQTAAAAGMNWALGDPADLELVSETDRHGKPLRTLVNLSTGLVRNDPVPGDEELARFYAEDYRTSYKAADKPRKRQIIRNFRRVAGHVRRFRDVIQKAGRVLDVGAGSGEFVFLAKALGKDVRGIEPNLGYAEYCREDLELDVAARHLAPDLFEPGQFELIRLNHVLEHLNNPVKYLSMVSEWLAPQGVLYVEVPDIEVYCRQKSRGNMFHYGHIFNFNPWTLRAAAGLAGLVEAGETAARSKGTTGVFLRRGERLDPEAAVNPDNGAHVRDMIRQHYAGGFPAGKTVKPFAKLAARLEETFTGMMAGSPRHIGDRIARTL